MTEHWKAER